MRVFPPSEYFHTHLSSINKRNLLTSCQLSFVAALIFSTTTLSVHADSMDDLVLALMKKGVLTEEEAAPLLKNQSLNQVKAKAESEIIASYADGITFQSADQANLVAINGRYCWPVMGACKPSPTV